MPRQNDDSASWAECRVGVDRIDDSNQLADVSTASRLSTVDALTGNLPLVNVREECRVSELFIRHMVTIRLSGGSLPSGTRPGGTGTVMI